MSQVQRWVMRGSQAVPCRRAMIQVPNTTASHAGLDPAGQGFKVQNETCGCFCRPQGLTVTHTIEARVILRSLHLSRLERLSGQSQGLGHLSIPQGACLLHFGKSQGPSKLGVTQALCSPEPVPSKRCSFTVLPPGSPSGCQVQPASEA